MESAHEEQGNGAGGTDAAGDPSTASRRQSREAAPFVTIYLVTVNTPLGDHPPAAIEAEHPLEAVVDFVTALKDDTEALAEMTGYNALMRTPMIVTVDVPS